MTRDLAERVQALKQSEIRKYSAQCAAMGGVNLSQGVCDQPAPDAVKAGAKEAIDADHAIYTHMRGIAELRNAIAEKMIRFNGIKADPESEIVVTVGTAGAFSCVILSTLNAGDEAVLFSPFYSYHLNVLKLFGTVVRFVDTRPPDWHFTREALESTITERTRMIVVNTPANPSGKVFSEDELRMVIDVAVKHDLLVVTDEIYEYITYDQPHVSAGRLPGAAERTVTISGASKTYAVTGWRVGYAVAPAALAEKIAVVSDQLYICSPAPLQHGIVAGMQLGEHYYEAMRDDYRVKRDMLADTLRDCGFEPYIPEGSYYMLAGFDRDRYRDDVHAAESILDEVGVASVPGSAFFANPDDGLYQLRFCYAKQMADLKDACDRLRRLSAAVPK